MNNWDKQVDVLMFRKSKSGLYGSRIRQRGADDDDWDAKPKTKYHRLINIRQSKDEFYDSLDIDQADVDG